MDSLVAAASTALRHLFGPGSPTVRHEEPRCVVRHVGRRRVGVEVAGRLVVLEPRWSSETLPCAVVVPGLDPAAFGPVGEPVRWVADGLATARASIRVTRWWAPSRVGRGCRAGEVADDRRPGRRRAAAADVLDVAVSDALACAAGALVRGDGRAAGRRLTDVLGRGAGSTPDADDAIAGLVLTARAVLPPAHDTALRTACSAVVAAAPARTTLLSRELLAAAADGVAARAVVDAVTRPTPGHRKQLLALGGTSGAATAAGVDVLLAAWHAATVRRSTGTDAA